MKRAIITGATGAVGIALIHTLIQNHVEAVAVVRPDSKRKKNIPDHPLVSKVECELNQLASLREKLHGTYDAFYHLGWSGTTGSGRDDLKTQNLNVKYTLDAADAAKELGCTVFVGAGSQAEYGRYEGKLNEDVPVNPENGYGIAKLSAGLMSRIACRQRGLKHIWTRILSVYGPFDGEHSMVIDTIGKLLNKETPAFTKAEQKWDYLYSADAGLALYLLGLKGKDGKTYCIGSGQARPLKEYIEIIKNVIDPDMSLEFGKIPYSEKQVMHLCADISSLKEDVGFEPRYLFREGIVKTVEWYKENVLLRKP